MKTDLAMNRRAKILIESLLDGVYIFLHLVFFSAMLGKTSGPCPPDLTNDCSRFTWLVVFIVISGLSWTVSLIYGLKDLFVGGKEDEGDMAGLRESLRQTGGKA